MAVRPIPEGYSSVTPYLIVGGAARAIDYYKLAFNATEIMRFEGPGGSIAHAELQIGNSRIMLGDESPQMGHKSPQTLGGSSVGLMIYVPDADAVFKRALNAGGEEVRPLQDQFYGDRSGTLNDPFGHQWTIATHVEDVPEEEMKRRMEAAMSAAE